MEIKKKSGGVNNLSKDWEDSVEEKILKISPQYQDVIDLRESKARLSTLENHLAELEKEKKEFTPLWLKIFSIVMIIEGVLMLCMTLMDGGFLFVLFGIVIIFCFGGILYTAPESNRKAKEAEEHIPVVEKEIEDLKKKIEKLEEEVVITE